MRVLLFLALVGLVSFVSGSGSRKIQLDVTPGSYPPQWRFIKDPLKSPSNFDIPFWVKAKSDAHLRLSSKPNAKAEDYYELFIDYKRGKFLCILRSKGQVKEVGLDAPTLNGNGFVDFRLKRNRGDLCLLTGKGDTIGCLWEDNPLANVKYIGVTSYIKDGPKTSSWWRFNSANFGGGPKSVSRSSRTPRPRPRPAPRASSSSSSSRSPRPRPRPRASSRTSSRSSRKRGSRSSKNSRKRKGSKSRKRKGSKSRKRKGSKSRKRKGSKSRKRKGGRKSSSRKRGSRRHGSSRSGRGGSSSNSGRSGKW